MAESIYDHPKWYDLIYGSDWKAEFDFLQGCFAKWLTSGTLSVFEPACGTGRLLYRLADAGYEVAGNDLNPKAIEYCNDRLARRGHPRTATVGDMCDFQMAKPVDAFFNTVSSFRHIIGQQLALGHLRCVAKSLKAGGIYVLGFHLTPTAAEPTESEAWSASRGHLTVNTDMRLMSRDLKQRIETYQTTLHVYTPTRQQTISELIRFQMYTLDEFTSLLEQVPELEIAEAFDFNYELDEPIELDEHVEDAVFILRKST